jgi:hypothetical protein
LSAAHPEPAEGSKLRREWKIPVAMITNGKGTAVSNPKRLLTLLVGSIAGWLTIFLVVGLPIFYAGFKVPISKIASFVGICCAIQVAVFAPWLFSASITPQRPEGRFTHRIIATTVFTTTVSILFFYYLRRSRPEDPATREFTLICMGVALIFGILYATIKLYLGWQREKTDEGSGPLT